MRIQLSTTRLWFEVDGLEYRFDADGFRQCPTIVVVHGGPGTDSTGLKLGYDFLAESAQVVFYDQRGHGRSEHSDPLHWNLDVWADDLAELCSNLELTCPVVIGTSFGGMVAARFAARHPHIAAGLCLVSTYPRVDVAGTIEAVSRVADSETAGVIESFYTCPSETTLWPYRKALGDLFERDRDVAAERDLIRRDRTESLDVYRHFVLGELWSMDLRQDLMRVTVPTLLLSGEDDPLATPASQSEMRAALGDRATQRTIPAAGHLLNLDAPEAFRNEVDAFIRSVAGGAE